MNITIIGAGSFGTAMAQELATNSSNKITLFFQDKAQARKFKQTQINENYYPNRQLDPVIKASPDWTVVKQAEIVFLAVPTKSFEDVVQSINPYLQDDTLLVNLAKGIYTGGRTLVDFLKEQLEHANTVTLKGPSFSAEMINRQATLLTLGFSSRDQLKRMKQIMAGTNIFMDYTSDIRGVEFLSALKNIYAIFLGNVDARYNATNTRFLVLTKAFSEVKLILKYLGGEEESMFLGGGFGDFNLTALNDLSRNRTLGLLIGKGFYNPSYQDNSVVLEGIKTLELIQSLIPDNLGDRLPILQQMIRFFLDKKESALQIDFDELFKKRYKTVLTYGTFDLLHFGHLEILRRAKELGDELIVGLSTDGFNEIKGKTCKFSYQKRKEFLESLSYVDRVIPEEKWEQKADDVQEYEADIFVMGHDWEGKFDFLKDYCDVHYFPRTKGISTTKIKELLDE